MPVPSYACPQPTACTELVIGCVSAIFPRWAETPPGPTPCLTHLCPQARPGQPRHRPLGTDQNAHISSSAGGTGMLAMKDEMGWTERVSFRAGSQSLERVECSTSMNLLMSRAGVWGWW